MRRLTAAGVAVLSIFAVGAGTAPSAQAESEAAPFWSINGAQLTKGESRSISAKVYNGNSFSLSGPVSGVKISCTALTDEQGLLLGSNGGEPGKDSEIIKYSGCSLVEGNGAPECKLTSSTITTEPLTSEQVENVAGSKRGDQLLEEFRATSASKGIATITFTGGTCTVSETIVSGQVVAEDLLATVREGKVELAEGVEQGTSLLLRFPPTPITSVWLIAGGVGKVQKTKEVSFNEEAVQTGTELVSLASGEIWGPQFKGESNLFSLTVAPQPVKKGANATFTVKNKGVAATVKEISFGGGIAEFTMNLVEVAGCKKAYLANATCTWKAKYEGAGNSFLVAIVEDEAKDLADKTLVGIQ
jgi:hypothetical protein